MLDRAINKGKHLTSFDRSFIEDALNRSFPLKEIARHLGKDPRTISKEIKRNRTFKISSFEYKGGCVHRRKCKVKHLCSDACHNLCKRCINLNCMKKCPEFKIKSCVALSKFPHVCNGCETRLSCKLDKCMYKSKIAEVSYRDALENSRKGINMTAGELEALDNLISPLIQRGQPLHHIYANHKDDIKCSERTLYEYIDKGYLSARNIDLRRKVKYKPRKKRTSTSGRSNHRIGRSYEDFCAYIAEHPMEEVVEMDTIIGRKGGKVILTLFFRKSSMMVALLLNSNTQECVSNAFEKIYKDVGLEIFQSSFSICITDNGSEFLDYKTLESDDEGNQRMRLFYCDPMASHQKGGVEKNHEFIRYVLPKGHSFDHLTQEKVTLLMNHINSVSRKKLNDKTPFDLAEILLRKELMDALSLKRVAADDVYLKEDLVDSKAIKRTLLETIRA